MVVRKLLLNEGCSFESINSNETKLYANINLIKKLMILKYVMQ